MTSRFRLGLRPAAVLLAAVFVWTSAADAQHGAWSAEFGVPGPAGGAVAVAALGDSIVVAGAPGTAGAAVVGDLALWDGHAWGPLADVDGFIHSLDVGPDGAVYVAGSFASVAGVPARNVARYDPRTRAWTALGAGVGDDGDRVHALAFGDGAVYAVGTFTNADGSPAVAAFDEATGTWAPLGTGGEPGRFAPFAVAYADGAVYVGGSFDQIGPTAARGVARYDLSRQSWEPLGAGVGGSVFDLVVRPDGVTVTGSFRTAGGAPALGVARWDGSAWSSLVDAEPGPFATTVLALADGSLVVAGEFDALDGTPARSVARRDGGAWAALGDGLPWPATDVVEMADGSLVAVGSVPINGDPTRSTANFLRRWDGERWGTVGAGDGLTDAVFAVAHDPAGDVVYAGGRFVRAGSTPARHVARRAGAGPWEPLGDGLPLPVEALALTDGTVYAASGGVVYRWDEARWTALPDVGDLLTLAVGPDGALYAGGVGVHRWDGSAWKSLDVGPGVTYSLLFASDGPLYAGGQYPTGGGWVNLRRQDGAEWETVGGLGDLAVWSLAEGPDGEVCAGINARGVSCVTAAGVEPRPGVGGAEDPYALATIGGVLYAGGQIHGGLATWADGQWTPLSGGVGGTVFALAATGGDVVVGGAFGTVGPAERRTPSVNFARWEPRPVAAADPPELGGRTLRVWPNPTASGATVRLGSMVHTGEVRVMDVLGRVVLREPVADQIDVSLTVSSLAPGVYVVRLLTVDGRSASAPLTVAR